MPLKLQSEGGGGRHVQDTFAKGRALRLNDDRLETSYLGILQASAPSMPCNGIEGRLAQDLMPGRL